MVPLATMIALGAYLALADRGWPHVIICVIAATLTVVRRV
jgi:hypothetical protein